MSVNPLASIVRNEFNLSPFARGVRHFYHYARTKTRGFTNSPWDMWNTDLFKSWWYYSVELFPGVTKAGIYPDDMPFLPRMLLRNCDLAHMDCLDLGSMEGVIPVLMCRQGAHKVVASDAGFHCYEKMAALQHYYKVNFRFAQTGLMYELGHKLRGEGGFDLINLSGVLYHVFSPMHVLAGLRPLLKRDGLMIVSTNVLNAPEVAAAFNAEGRLQPERNTFWYLSIPLFEYLLRYFRLAPIDCRYWPRLKDSGVHYVPGMDSGYLSVVCRATDDDATDSDDRWAFESSRISWEYFNLCDSNMLCRQPASNIQYKADLNQQFLHADKRSIDLCKAVQGSKPVLRAQDHQDSHLLMLADQF